MTATTNSLSDVVFVIEAGREPVALPTAADEWNAGWLHATASDARDLLAQIDYGQAIAAAIHKVQTMLDADSASICLRDSSTAVVQHVLAADQEVDGVALGAGASLPHLAENNVVQRRSACTTCRLLPQASWCASAPLYAEGRQFGVLCAIRKPPHPPFGRTQLHMLQFLAFWAGIAIANARKVHAAAALLRSERERIAAHLHDNTAQSLSVIGLKVNQIETALGAALPEAAQLPLETIKSISQELITQVRAAFGELLQAAAQPQDLVSALAGCTDAFTAATQLPVDFSVSGACLLSGNAQGQAVEIVREALNNVARHAHASRVQLSLLGDCNTVRIVLHDDGVGFDLHQVGADQRHLGTLLMRERAQRSGGTLTIASHPGRGTQVALAYPATPQPSLPPGQ